MDSLEKLEESLLVQAGQVFPREIGTRPTLCKLTGKPITPGKYKELGLESRFDQLVSLSSISAKIEENRGLVCSLTFCAGPSTGPINRFNWARRHAESPIRVIYRDIGR